MKINACGFGVLMGFVVKSIDGNLFTSFVLSDFNPVDSTTQVINVRGNYSSFGFAILLTSPAIQSLHKF